MKGEGNMAVIATGGKQYKVKAGDTLKIEKIKGDYKVGDEITFDQVLMSAGGGETKIGAPYIFGAKVVAEITEIDRSKKVTVVHYKQKSRYYKKYGHRQPYFKVKISGISS